MKYDNYVLGCLMEGPHYGYEIKKKFEESFGCCQKISNNTIYPILAKFYKKGLVNKTLETPVGAPSRKIYTITAEGRLAFAEDLKYFDETLLESRDVFFLKLYFFLYHTPEQRQRILSYRKHYVERILSFLQEKKDHWESTEEYQREMQEFHRSLLENEILLIHKLEQRISEPCLIDETGKLIDTTASVKGKPFSPMNCVAN